MIAAFKKESCCKYHFHSYLKMLHLFIAVTLTWLCSCNIVNATQTPKTIGNDTLPDKAEIVLHLISWPLQGPSPLKYSHFYIINEYKGWQIIRQSLCDTGPQEDLPMKKVSVWESKSKGCLFGVCSNGGETSHNHAKANDWTNDENDRRLAKAALS